MIRKALVLFTCLASALVFSQATTPAKTTYILAGRLFDATNESVRENQVVVIEGERIKTVAAAASVKIPAGSDCDRSFESYGATGIDRLSYPSGIRSDRYDEIYDFKMTPFDSAFSGVVNAQ